MTRFGRSLGHPDEEGRPEERLHWTEVAQEAFGSIMDLDTDPEGHSEGHLHNAPAPVADSQASHEGRADTSAVPIGEQVSIRNLL